MEWSSGASVFNCIFRCIYKNLSAVAAFNEANAGSLVALAGFEMTWSGGPGHINTFNTPGIVSRNNTTLNNKTDYAGMRAYYALLSQQEGADSLSQFNHPGNTFGTFGDFAFWDPVIDSRMYMVEAGNGEGQIGAGGYYPSYEYYTMALDKGWHLAPTNNQDNHKGRWGNANDARDVILTDDFSEEGIYDALRAMGVSLLPRIRYAVLPQLGPAFSSAVLYRFDVNIREASVLGLVGAGGIGAPLIFAMNQYAWNDVSAIFLGFVLLVWLIDVGSARLRTRRTAAAAPGK